MNLIQILLSLYFAFIGAYLSVALTRILIQNGKAIRELGEKMTQQHHDMVQQMAHQHQDMVELLKQLHQDMIQQHQDMIELLKRGFGDLSRDIREIKEK